MNEFYEVLEFMNQTIYEPNQLIAESIQAENQNAEYGAGTFQLASKTVRFRVAKRTPTKIGQFVVFWEKDSTNKNRPYLSEEAPDLLVITTFKNKDEWGQFIFPKKILIEKNILQTSFSKGKMAMRVYPSWDKPTSKQAIHTQKWQLPYFVDISILNQASMDRINKLYTF
ncbi:hypothetical protein BW727_101248 [Jeotgalibaca dankookensis]|uniref:MepB protein n=1 Tax=Jeotgalibaca dankookensis TaxID=708126 RepID=A0A1S6IPY8_9LACT|nr:MepB family protein [Jeotgalibaca dankookensis]AQS53615.1 hypothetical protein BW727_101248 [Jeotgalibaca dankookensis]